MDTLRDRLADLAEDAPTGGVPAADLWARGRRAHRLRVVGLAAAVAVGALGTGLGVRLADGDDSRSDVEPARSIGITLPIEYPVGEELPELGDTPGPLAAIWFVRGADGGTPESVGLVADSGRFGTLPIEVSQVYTRSGSYFALSPDGRRIAYNTPADELVVRDLVTGESFSPRVEDLGTHPEQGYLGYTWADSTHLVGHWDGGPDQTVGEADGWVWQPGTAPKRVDLLDYPGSVYTGPNAGHDPWHFLLDEGDPGPCPSVRKVGKRTLPQLCDLLGVISSDMALTHDRDRAVVALGSGGVVDPALRHVVVTAGGPLRVTFATDLIGYALSRTGAAS